MRQRPEIARVWDLFRLGAFTEAEASLASLQHDPQAQRILLWIAIRRGDVENKLYFGSRLALCDDAELAAVGRAHENVALATSEQSPRPWLNPPTRWSQAEVAYARALFAFMRGENQQIRSELAQALPKTMEQRVRFAQLRAWERALVDDFPAQARLLSHSLTLALDADVDHTLVAIIAGSLAIIVRELELGEVDGHIDELFGRIVWPADNSVYRFYAQRGMAWRHAVKGEWIRAMHLLDQALGIVPDNMREALIFLDRARISRAVSEDMAAVSASAFALERFESLDWSRAANDEVTGVLTAMDVLSQHGERARRLFDRVMATPISKMSGGAHGHRLDAFVSFAQSFFNDGSAALASVQTAYALFKKMQYVHRATDCAIRAVELGGGSRWRARAERLVTNYPRSLAAHRYQGLISPLQKIRGRRRDVFELLVHTSKTAREIGSQLGIAEGTVRVHVRDIYRVLGLESRTQLVRFYFAEAESRSHEDHLITSRRLISSAH